MKTTDAVGRRNKRNGQYAHNLDAVCVCGHRKGEHDAEAPYAMSEGDTECEAFKKAK